MNPQTLDQLVREIIPLLGTTWVDNYEAKEDWCKRAEKALEPEPVEEPTRVWPAGPPVCSCEQFDGEGWFCDTCGGGRF